MGLFVPVPYGSIINVNKQHFEVKKNKKNGRNLWCSRLSKILYSVLTDVSEITIAFIFMSSLPLCYQYSFLNSAYFQVTFRRQSLVRICSQTIHLRLQNFY
jgi:hypothetical protein